MPKRRELLPTLASDDEDEQMLDDDDVVPVKKLKPGKGIKKNKNAPAAPVKEERATGEDEEVDGAGLVLSDDDEEGVEETGYNTAQNLLRRKLIERTKKASAASSAVPRGTVSVPVESVTKGPQVADTAEAQRLAAQKKKEEEEEEEEAVVDVDTEFFEKPAEPAANTTTFEDLNLTPGMLKSIKKMGYVTPTPVQANAISVALAGKSVCASAVTGSGKTAAFLIPIIERLTKGRPSRLSDGNCARAVVLLPTRELAVQCAEVFEKLAAHTRLDHLVVVGGAAMREQQQALQRGVDVVIATPGRLIDHVLNSPAVSFHGLEILVLDEADQLLDLGFQRQIEQIVHACPKERRQTLLFSATMTNQVDKLANLALHKPVWLAVDKKYDMTEKLTHELVRLQAEDDEGEWDDDSKQLEEVRGAALLVVCTSLVQSRALIFCTTKTDAHRVMLVLSLAGLKAADLHGDLTHAQRMEALNKFKSHEVDFLVSTDLAARGLDIEGVKAVVNYRLPLTLVRYVHRVGRTARAGKIGRAISLACNRDTDLLSDVMKHTQGKVVRRTLEATELNKWRGKMAEMKDDLEEVLMAEEQDKETYQAMKEVQKAANILAHQDEILARPKKQWFQSGAEKLADRKAQKMIDNGAKNVSMKEPASKRRKGAPDGDDKKAEMERKKDEKRKQQLHQQKKAIAQEAREARASARSAKKDYKKGLYDPRKELKKESLARKTVKKEQRRVSAANRSETKKPVDPFTSKLPYIPKGKKKAHNAFKSKKRFKRR